MPGRAIPLAEGEIYHIFNRGLDRRPTFTDKKEYQRALLILKFYPFKVPPVKLSRFLTLSNEIQEEMMSDLTKSGEKLVDILAFCLMPNHFHLLLKQLLPNGISKFLSNFQNSYTRYFNIKHERVGSLFLDQFKAVRVETDEQLLHVLRYIHLNPFSSFVVKQVEEVETYPWSSAPEYMKQADPRTSISRTDFVLSFFKNLELYRSFIRDQADYQREFKQIEHLLLENP